VTVYLVGAGPGDPGLLTRRGAEVLSRADVVVYDRLVDPALLALAPPAALLLEAGQAGRGEPSGARRQEEIDDLLARHGREGRTVVRLKGGDPFLFGRGGEEAEALTRAGVDWEIVPGVSSATAVPAYAGIPVTHRGLSTSVTVVTGRVGAAASSGVDWEALARIEGTLVVLMGMANRAEISRRLVAGGRPPETPVAVIEWGTTPSQRAVRTTLAGLPEVELGAPGVVVVGAVAALDLDWVSDRPLAGTTVVVTRARSQAGPLTEALGAAGARVVEVPVVETADPEDGGEALQRAAKEVAAYDWVVFTSANAVHRLVPLLRDGRAFGSARLAAVGGATRDALGAYHLVADLVPDATGASGAEGLVSAFPDAPTGGRVLFPRAAGARRTVPEGLAARGWAVDEVTAYRTVPAQPPVAAVADAAAGADVVTFTSPSTVESYLSLRDDAGRPLPVPEVVACIGPTTAEAARRSGLTVAVEADDASVEALASALAAHLRTAVRPSS
jgi:uroporphyrinogen III methyltransferase/synthase